MMTNDDKSRCFSMAGWGFVCGLAGAPMGRSARPRPRGGIGEGVAEGRRMSQDVAGAPRRERPCREGARLRGHDDLCESSTF
jgi:hypothetical protein